MHVLDKPTLRNQLVTERNINKQLRHDLALAQQRLAIAEMKPMQPLIDGRFKENKIVSYCLDNNTNMNDIAMQDFSTEDREQFAQLIGYSLGGFGDLSYVTDETYYRADDFKPTELPPAP